MEIKRGIVITTSEHTKDFLKPCLESIKDTVYDILVVSNGGYVPDFLSNTANGKKVDNGWYERSDGLKFLYIINNWNGWEIAGIQRGKENFDEFVHIMDSTLIKDISLFDKLFAIDGNVVLTKGNFHYMGKFVSKLLPNSPKVFTKDVAIMMEVRWLPQPYTEFTPDLPVHTNVFEVIHGQKRMVLENEYMKKWKGTWVRSKEHP